MEKGMEENLQRIVKLYFDGYSVSEAIQVINKSIQKERTLIRGSLKLNH